jgi:Fur family transcriptional regulator, ferric uptake regulator
MDQDKVDSGADSDELRKAGLKATLPRLKILAVLERNQARHMSAEDVYRSLMEAGDDVGLATVYRVLTQFEAAGFVVRHNFAEGHAVFELDSGLHHDHIVCVDCGSVVEFVDATIERRQTSIAQEHGFDITDHSMVIYGHCSKKRCPNRPAG